MFILLRWRCTLISAGSLISILMKHLCKIHRVLLDGLLHGRHSTLNVSGPRTWGLVFNSHPSLLGSGMLMRPSDGRTPPRARGAGRLLANLSGYLEFRAAGEAVWGDDCWTRGISTNRPIFSSLSRWNSANLKNNLFPVASWMERVAQQNQSS